MLAQERPVRYSLTLAPVGRAVGSGDAYRGLDPRRGGSFRAHYRLPRSNIELGLVFDGAGLGIEGSSEDYSDVGVFVEGRSVRQMRSPKLSLVAGTRIGFASQTAGSGALAASRSGFAFGLVVGLRYALSPQFALEADVWDRLAFFGDFEEGDGSGGSGTLSVLQLGVTYLGRR